MNCISVPFKNIRVSPLKELFDSGENDNGSHASVPFYLHSPSRDEQLIGGLREEVERGLWRIACA